jgi:hypothetical protein
VVTVSTRTKTLVKATLAGLVLAVGMPTAVPSMSSADAKEFYTRKRVNGVWIKGHFRRKKPRTAAAAQGGSPTLPKKAAAVPVAVAYLGSVDDLSPAFQRAAEARQQAMGFDPASSLPDVDRLIPLRRALEAKARAMAAPALPVSPRIRTVTFDFEVGVRTVTYDDGSIREEPFDLTTGTTSLTHR